MEIFTYFIYAVVLTLLYKIGSFIIRKRYKEPSFVGFRATRPVEALKMLKIVAFFVFLGLLLWFSLVYGASDVFAYDFITDFDNYDLGALTGQDNWQFISGSDQMSVQDSVVVSGNALEYPNTYGSGIYLRAMEESLTTGSISYFFRLYDSGDPYSAVARTDMRVGNGTSTCGTSCILGEGLWGTLPNHVLFAYYMDSNGSVVHLKDSLSWDTWYNLQAEWDTTMGKCRYQIDSEGWTDWVFCWVSPSSAQSLTFFGATDYTLYPTFFYIDSQSGEPPPEPEFRIWGIDPVSTTEITASSTEFTFGYEGFATSTEGYAGWNGILVNFCEETTGICAEEKKYTKSELSGTSGEKTLSFENFNFDANGHWDLIGSAYFGSFNFDWEWVEGYTGNAVSPDYYVMINFEGLPEIFQVEVPATWYSEHTEYATSTAFFSTISGILTPLFSKIGDFGSRISGFFNQDEAYSRGKNIGAILPTFKLYIAQFSFLFGGFPIIETFILAMVVMVGFFLFKLVFRIVRG